MRRLLNILCMVWVCVLIGGISEAADQAQILSQSQGIETPETIEVSRAYEVYKSHNKVHSGEIKYLIHLVKHSKLKVVQAGREYSSTQAAQYLNVKYRTHAMSLKSAEDFIDQYASYTKKGDPIYVMDSTGEKVMARQVLYDELRQLRDFENKLISRYKM